MIFIVICNDVWRCLWCSIMVISLIKVLIIGMMIGQFQMCIYNYIYTWSFLVGKPKHEALINETLVIYNV